MLLEEFIKLVEDEPEFPGEIPQEMREEMLAYARRDPENFTRAIVKVTKERIVDRLWELGVLR